MTRQIAPEALIALEFPGLPFHDSFHGLAVSGRWPPERSGLPPALALRVLAAPVLPIVTADGVGPAQEKMITDREGGRRQPDRQVGWFSGTRAQGWVAPCSIRRQFTKAAQSIRTW
jgi:hypothetical protein